MSLRKRGSFYQCSQPVQKSQPPACKYPIEDHRSGDGEDLAADAEDLSLLLVLDSRCRHRVGKSGDRDQCACAAPFGQLRVDTDSGEKHTEQYQYDRGPGTAVLSGEPLHLTVMPDDLSDDADQPAQEKGPEHIGRQIMSGGLLFYILFIFLLLFQLLYFIHISYNHPFRVPEPCNPISVLLASVSAETSENIPANRNNKGKTADNIHIWKTKSEKSNPKNEIWKRNEEKLWNRIIRTAR